MCIFLLSIPYFYASDSSVSAGMNLTIKINNTNSPRSSTLYDITNNLNYPFPLSSDLDSDTVTYTNSLDMHDYPHSIQLQIFKSGDLLTPYCYSNYNTSNPFSCTINYDNTFISSLQDLSFHYCNDLGGCGVTSGSFPFVQLNNAERINAGMSLTMQSAFDLYEEIPVNYQTPPTPIDGLRKAGLENFTVKVYNGGKTISNCILIVENDTYLMSYDDTYCTYTYSLNSSLGMSSVSFYVNYTLNNTEYSLAKRTVYNYPDNSSDNFSSFSLVSLLLAFLLLGGFMLK
jgi:hypothetical protein